MDARMHRWDVHAVEQQSPYKGRKFPHRLHTTRLKLEDNVPTEISQSRKGKYHTTPSMRCWRDPIHRGRGENGGSQGLDEGEQGAV